MSHARKEYEDFKSQAPDAYEIVLALGKAAAKAGIALLSQQAAAQAGPFGIRFNCIAPETILTERNVQQIPAGLRTTLADAHPLRRLGTPQDVAAELVGMI